MQPLIALLLAAATACAVARPPGPTAAPALLQAHMWPQRVPAPPARDSFGNFLMPRVLFPHLLSYDESPRVPPPIPENDWLNKEIDRINQMEEDEINPYEVELAQWIAQDPNMQHIFEVPISEQEPLNYAESVRPVEDLKQFTAGASGPDLAEFRKQQETNDKISSTPIEDAREAKRREFALTPQDKGYYDRYNEKPRSRPKLMTGVAHEGGEPISTIILEPPRQIRQNPNLNKQKHLLQPDIGILKTGLTNKDYRLPVSLLPTNLRWLKVNQPIDDEESSHDENDGTEKPPYFHMLETSAADPADSIYGIALIAAVGAALTMAVFGFAFGWYTLSKKAKAAADVDYPAYGVTGPTVDTSGDRKLAHSAHMYHYQHQKQQIIAMERNGLEQRTGSVSDPESEEENEEGDYTVYECPGFATTGDMEVKNPLFNEEPTSAKCEVVKQQPKE